MLVLSRKAGESIVINGDIQVVVVSMEGNKCRLGVVAPPAVPVHRQEVYEKLLAHQDDRSTLSFTGKTTGDNSLAADMGSNSAQCGGGNLVRAFTHVPSIN